MPPGAGTVVLLGIGDEDEGVGPSVGSGLELEDTSDTFFLLLETGDFLLLEE